MRLARATGGKRACSLALLGWLGMACVPACDRERECRLGAEHEVLATTAKVIDAIAIVPLRGRALVLSSEPAGLFVRVLTAAGKPLGRTVRLGDRCAGGLDALSEASTVTVACLVRPEGGRVGKSPAVTVGVRLLELSLQADRVASVLAPEALLPVGSSSEGVTLARKGTTLAVAWHEGTPEAQRIWLVEGKSAPRAVSETGRVARTPDLAVHRGKLALIWNERWATGQARDEVRGRIAYLPLGAQSAQTLVERPHLDASPQLVPLDRRLLLALRDHGPDTRKTGLYVAELNDSKRPISMRERSVRVGRADGIARPALAPCMRGLVVATPRTYAGDYFVGINWLDASLQKPRREQQFYEDARAFTHASLACLGSHALLLVAEHPQLGYEVATVRAATYRCD